MDALLPDSFPEPFHFLEAKRYSILPSRNSLIPSTPLSLNIAMDQPGCSGEDTERKDRRFSTCFVSNLLFVSFPPGYLLKPSQDANSSLFNMRRLIRSGYNLLAHVDLENSSQESQSGRFVVGLFHTLGHFTLQHPLTTNPTWTYCHCYQRNTLRAADSYPLCNLFSSLYPFLP